MTSWLDSNGCGNCDKCGMDMDMSPFCTDVITLAKAEETLGKVFPYGLNINPARLICKGDSFVVREKRG